MNLVDNKISNIDLSKNLLIQELRLGINQLSSIDLSVNSAIGYLDLQRNNLTQINLSQLITLKIAELEQNKLTSLDLSNNSNLQAITCSYNKLTSLTLENKPDLGLIVCDHNQISNLTLNKLKSLGKLDCSYNKINTLDVSNFTFLDKLYCTSNQINYLKLGLSGVTDLRCDSNNLSKIEDLSKVTWLKILNCSYNKFTNLDLSNFPNLILLYCSNNDLYSLNVIKSNLLNYFNSTNNPSLYYVCVPNVNNALNNINFKKDTQTQYTSNCILLDVDSFSSQQVSIYPNPSLNGSLRINANSEVLEININNSLGQKEHFEKTSFFTTTFKGLLFIEVKTIESIYTYKVIIE